MFIILSPGFVERRSKVSMQRFICITNHLTMGCDYYIYTVLKIAHSVAFQSSKKSSLNFMNRPNVGIALIKLSPKPVYLYIYTVANMMRPTTVQFIRQSDDHRLKRKTTKLVKSICQSI